MTTRSAVYKETIELVPIDLDKTEEYNELQDQRKLCGWKFSDETLDFWKWLSQRKLKMMFWVVIPSLNHTRSGHISLDCANFTTIDPQLKPELEKNPPDRTTMTIATFFLKPEFQSKGVGRVALDMLEDMATKEPYGSSETKTIVVDTFPSRFCQAETFRQAWRELGIEPGDDWKPHWPNAEAWYRRRGYIWYKEEPSYEDNIAGKVEKLPGVYLRKDL